MKMEIFYRGKDQFIVKPVEYYQQKRILKQAKRKVPSIKNLHKKLGESNGR